MDDVELDGHRWKITRSRRYPLPTVNHPGSRISSLYRRGLLVVIGALAVVPAAYARTVTVRASAHLATLRVGDRLVIDLAENPSTGYAWKTLTRPPALRFRSSRYAATAPPSPPGSPALVGGGGRRTFTYGAVRQGSGRLTFVYQRSFAPSATDKKFVVRVFVKR